MKKIVTTDLLAAGSVPESDLTYVVMAASFHNEWIFVRHRERTSWEMPAGHIEPGESADQAAVRELYEEAGVVSSSMTHLCDYSVTFRGKTEYGRLYRASVGELEELPEHEIAEILLSDQLPRQLTYPEVQTVLFNHAIS